MIKVIYSKNEIIIKGHSNYGDYGKDIVCASVSSIVYTTINGIYNISDDSIDVLDNEDLRIIIKKNNDIIDKLINNMICLLKELEQQYPKNLKISKGD